MRYRKGDNVIFASYEGFDGYKGIVSADHGNGLYDVRLENGQLQCAHWAELQLRPQTNIVKLRFEMSWK